MAATFAQDSTETEDYLGEKITVWRTFEFENGARRPTRRYHFDVSSRFFANDFASRDEAFASARHHIWLEQYRDDNFGGRPQELHGGSVPEEDEKAVRLRERLEQVTEANGFCPAEVELAKRKLGR